ncbi:MAG: hypothetical protein EOP00_35380, partial [Pedobacter sp.]
MRCFLFLLVFAIGCSSPVKEEKETKKNSNGEVSIAYDLKGNGDTLLVFVHGWAINKTYWQHQVD